MHRTGDARPRPLVHRRHRAGASQRAGRCHLPDGRRPVARSAPSAGADRGDRARRPRDRLAVRAGRRDRQLAAPAAAAQPLREHLHPPGHAAERARLHQRLPLLAARGARRAAARRTSSSDGYSFLVEMLFVAAARAAARIAEVPITFVERRQGESKLSQGGAARVGDHAVAADRVAQTGAARPRR